MLTSNGLDTRKSNPELNKTLAEKNDLLKNVQEGVFRSDLKKLESIVNMADHKSIKSEKVKKIRFGLKKTSKLGDTASQKSSF